MHTNDFRQYTVVELIDQIRELEDKLFKLKMRHGVGQLEDTSKLHHVRKDVARAKTVLREHHLGIRLLAGHN